MDAHEIHLIRLESVTEVGTQSEGDGVVARVGWPMLVEFDREIDIARRVGRLGGVGAEENREPNRMLPEDSLEGVEIEGSIDR